MRRALVAIAALGGVCALGAAAAAGAALPDRYILPGDAVFPEGVATRPGTDEFFVTSTTDGTVFRGRLGRERMSVFLPAGGDGRVDAVGLRATRDRLVVAGGDTGRIFVYDLRTRRLLRRFSTGTGGVINDVAITPSGDAYVTDSPRSLLFRIPARDLVRRRANVTRLRSFARFPESLAPGGYPNGVAPAGRHHVIVGFLGSGRLARVDLRTRALRRVQLGASEVPAPDGIVTRGRTAYVVNSGSRVTQLALSADYARARAVRQITSPSFRLPTTVAVAGRRLLVVNSQFDRRSSPELPFTVSSVPRP
jgi:sugar lactone lactonase YvrE